MKLTDMVISAILKKGILYEAKNCDINIDVPTKDDNGIFDGNIKINFKCDNMSLRVEREEKA